MHWNFKGTHTGTAFGLPATGNKLDLSGTTLVTMKDGKIAKEQDFFDVTQMLNKLTTGDVNMMRPILEYYNYFNSLLISASRSSMITTYILRKFNLYSKYLFTIEKFAFSFLSFSIALTSFYHILSLIHFDHLEQL